MERKEITKSLEKKEVIKHCIFGETCCEGTNKHVHLVVEYSIGYLSCYYIATDKEKILYQGSSLAQAINRYFGE